MPWSPGQVAARGDESGQRSLNLIFPWNIHRESHPIRSLIPGNHQRLPVWASLKNWYTSTVLFKKCHFGDILAATIPKERPQDRIPTPFNAITFSRFFV